jgi:hypothetical protein
MPRWKRLFLQGSLLIPVLGLRLRNMWLATRCVNFTLCTEYIWVCRLNCNYWLPTAAARVQNRVWSSGICGGQSGGGAGFLRVLRFPLPISIPLNSPSS